MPAICYKAQSFQPETRYIIDEANVIINKFLDKGLELTVRQLYYQFIAKNLFPDSWTDKKLHTKNTEKNYKRMGSIINNGRMAGLIDWYAIEDRTRNLEYMVHWDNPGEMLRMRARTFHLDHWEGQIFYPEVWIEKEALTGVIESVCNKLDVPYFACRGYVSQSEMWAAAKRLDEHDGEPVIIHLGDHDPSGVDMTRDIIDRLELFMDREIIVKRIALNMDQIEEHDPPPSPAKPSDSRTNGYLSKFGEDSWELDALEPDILQGLIKDTVTDLRDEVVYREVLDKQQRYREELRAFADTYKE